jgi:hypothetical protein
VTRAALDTDAILSFLELPSEEPSHDYLRRLLIAYRDRVPYETATRLLRYRDIQRPEDRVRYPDEFWREKLSLGAGGSCSDSTYAFKKLLDELGFECAMAVGSEGAVERDESGNVLELPPKRSHCSVIVELGGDRYVADPCCGHYIKVPLPLDNPERVEIEGATEEGCPYHYAVEPLGEAGGERFYELHNLGPDGGAYPEESQMYIFHDRAFTDAEFEEHMRFGYREGYSSDHLSFLSRHRRTRIEYRYSSRSGRLKWRHFGPWRNAPEQRDPAPLLATVSGIPLNVMREALAHLKYARG